MNPADASEKTVLIVEDHFDIRVTLSEFFEHEGYAVFAAMNGQEGLDRLRTIGGACVVVLDYMMPVVDGREFLKTVRADAALKATPVIVLSAHAEARNVFGADGFMHKPPDLDRLASMVSRLMK